MEPIERLAHLCLQGTEVYKLTYDDAMAVLVQKLGVTKVLALPDSELQELLDDVVDGFEHIDWMMYGEGGLHDNDSE